MKAGRVIAGTEVRIVDDAGARTCPATVSPSGEIEVRGPWITGSYYDVEVPEKFRDGWLRTGDAGTIDPTGYGHAHATGSRTSSRAAASGSPRSSWRTR